MRFSYFNFSQPDVSVEFNRKLFSVVKNWVITPFFHTKFSPRIHMVYYMPTIYIIFVFGIVPFSIVKILLYKNVYK